MYGLQLTGNLTVSIYKNGNLVGDISDYMPMQLPSVVHQN